MAELPFIGRGWSFPPTFRKDTCGVDMLTGKDDIQSSLEILLSTGIGERIMRPKYGANLERLVFEPLDTSLQASIRDLIEKAIIQFEPRVLLNAVNLEAVPEEGLVRILIDYTIAGTNTRNNFVFPFFRVEGTEIPQSNLPSTP